MTDRRRAGQAGRTERAALAATVAGILALTGCAGGLDADLRDSADGRLDTSEAARGAAAPRPRPDQRGLISYPSYQVAVARRGDTVRDVAARLGVDAGQLARYNGVAEDAVLNADAVLALPSRVGGAAGRRDITSIAGAAIDRAEGTRPAPRAPATQAGPEPVRHQVARGETAFSIARLYGVGVRSLADWNGLGPDLTVREGQYLLIPLVVAGTAPEPVEVSTLRPGEDATPLPPSAASALPEPVVAEPLPPSPNLDQFRTAAAPPPPTEAPAPPAPAARGSSDSRPTLQRPVAGTVREGFSQRNEGLDFAAPTGAAVSAAADGTVAAITRDTDQVPILVLRHDDGLLTVYANIDDIRVEKGDSVRAGQRIASVGGGDPSYLHFELRRGLDPVDPTPFLR